MDIKVGDQVKAVRAGSRHVSCEARNIGKVGVVIDVSDFLGEPWVTVEFPWGYDECDAVAVEKI